MAGLPAPAVLVYVLDMGEPDSTLPPTPQPGRVGQSVLQDALASLPQAPGVYRMLDRSGEALYVGKAKNLAKRVPAYLQDSRLPERLRRMVRETHSLEVITTPTEVEALLLEANLIKQLKPRFNIVLRDDKSYLNLLLTEDHPFPQITRHRGARTRKGSYFGPFASSWAVNQTMKALQRVFLLRSCTDSVFDARTRPCLLFQIRRCSAPCVGRVDEAGYGALVADARQFLEGGTSGVQQALGREMEAAAEALEFERAATLRDRIRGLAQIQGQDVVNQDNLEDADVIAIHCAGGTSCVQVFFFRGGRNQGNRAHFPQHGKGEDEASILQAFVAQFYDDKPPPQLVLLSHALPEAELLSSALTLKAASFRTEGRARRVELQAPQRGPKRAVVEHALQNAREALGRRMAEGAAQTRLLDAVGEAFGLDGPPRRVEVYDNSHLMGTNPYGVMVVAGPDGFVKGAYRKFAIRGPERVVKQPRGENQQATDPAPPRGGDPASAPVPPRGGDDFAMMREVLKRRFARMLKAEGARDAATGDLPEGVSDPDEPPSPTKAGGWDRPDLLLIDGGAGQLSAVCGVLDELGLASIPVVAIAKGPDRDAGRERFFLPNREPFQLPERDPVLYYLQRLRDEAHRFAIGAHRTGRAKALVTSALDEVEGIGPARKKALLHHFGSARGVARAGLDDLEAVRGIDAGMARRIYAHFHPGASLAEPPNRPRRAGPAQSPGSGTDGGPAPAEPDPGQRGEDAA